MSLLTALMVFFVAENDTVLLYSQGGLYNPNTERSIRWDDPMIGVDWPKSKDYILSDRDRDADFIKDDWKK